MERSEVKNLNDPSLSQMLRFAQHDKGGNWGFSHML